MTTCVTLWLRLALLLLCVNLSGMLLADSRLNADGGSWLNTDEHGAEGTEFYLTFMRNYGKPVGDKDLVLTIYATSRYDTKVYVEGKWTDIGSDVSLDWDTTFTVHANSYASANIPSQVAYLAEPKNTSAEYLNKGLKITSDKVITLYSSNSNSDSYDASLIYPVETYSKEYVIQTFSSDNQATQLAVISSQDNNLVTVNIKETESGKNGDKIRTDTFTLSLNQGQTWLYQPEDKKYSLSGSTICATEPVTILQGGQHARIPSGKGELSHCYVNAVPTDALGKNYIVTRTAKQKFDYVTFVAAEDSTQIFKEGKLLATIDQLETYQDIVEWKSDKEAYYYFTSKATGCFLFQSGRDCDTGSPTITDITAIENSIHKITFACFDYRYTQEETFSLDNHYVNIVLPKRYIGSMTIDGNPIGKTLFKDIEYLINNEQYAYATCKITEGNHVLQNTSGGFVARVYGQDNINEEDDDYGIGEITYSYSAGRNILHPAWILIDGKRVNQKAICEGDPPITFTSVINYDYTNVRWEFHSLQGKIYDDTIIRTVRGDSVISRQYIDVEGDSTTSVHIDSVYMIVDRTTPLCSYTITDTIKAAIIVNDTFALQDRQNVCYGDTMTLHYQGTEVKIPADTLRTYKFGTKSYRFSLNTPYSFVDSLKTNSACDTCKHCDSIINQVRIIRPIYNYTVQDSICVNHLPYQWRDSLGNLIRELDLPDSIKNKLILKSENAYRTETIWDSENFGTIYGCDSIVNIELTVLPIYDLHDYDTVCVDSVRAYSWYRHPYASGKYFYTNGKKVSYIPQNTSGEFEYVDSLTTKGCIQCADSLGCDSIWTLHLKVLDRHIDESWGSICSNESYLWQDTLWLGWNFPEDELSSLTHKYKYVYKRDTTLRVTYPTEDAFGCDSTIILHLKIYPAYPEVSYNDTTYVHICENEPYEFYGTTYNANGEWCTVDHSIGRQVLTYMDATSHDCDSAVTHVIYVHPTYLDTISVTECQSHTSTYKWAEITETSIWDKQRDKHISPNDIPLNEAGDFIYVDSTKTKTCTDCRNGIGCDSVIVLKLHVNPIFDTIESKPLCENDTLHWRGKTYVGGKAADAIAAGATKRYWANPIPNPNTAEDTYRLPKTYEEIDHKWNGNKYTDSIHFTTKDGCDSIYWLELTVYPSYEIHDTLHVCDNKSIDWEGKTYAGSKFEGAADYKYATSDNWYTDTRSFLIGNACDSVRILHLKVHPSYDSVYVDSVCQDYSYVWDKHMNRILYDSIQQRDIFFSDSIPTFEPGWHTYVDNLSTTTCAECEDGSCDSIWTLRLYVKPTAVHTEYITICPEQLPYPYGSNGKFATQAGTYLDTIHRSYGDGCDSITTYVINVSEENRSVFHVTICNNELPYNYDYGSTPTANLHFTNLTQSDTYYDTIRIAGMCNHILELHLTINDTTRTDTTYYLCEGDTYVDKDFSEIKATRDTSYVKRLERANRVGCDSVVYVTVKFGSTHEVHDADVILCEHDSSYTWHTQDTYGTYSQTIKWSDLYETVLDTVLYQTLHTMSPFYCDSVTSVRIQVKPTVYNEYYKTICPTEVPFSDWGNRDEAVSANGTYTHYIVGGSLRYGCDSIEIMHLTISDSIVTHLDTTICNNELPYNHISSDVTPNLMGLTTTGIYRQILTSVSGCDSTIVLHLTVNDTTVLDTTYYLCEGDTYVDKDFTDIIATRDTSYVKRLERANSVGCDSVVYVTVKFGATHDVHDADVILCEHDSSYTWHTQDTYGTYSQTIKWSDLHETVLDTVLYQTLHTMSPFYCDSVTSVRIQVKPTVYNEYYKTICPTEVPFSDWGNRDEAVSANGTYTHYIIGGSLRYGCDSIEIMHLTISDSIVTHLDTTICNNELPYNHISSDVTPNLMGLTTTGIYRQILTSASGCDSTIVLHLTVNDTTVLDTTYYLCEGDTYVDKDFTDIIATRDTSYVKRLERANSVGCDSVVYVTVKFGSTHDVHDADVILCERDSSYTWHTQDTYGTYSQTIKWSDLHETVLDTVLYQTLHTMSPFYCDSVTSVRIQVKPTVYNEYYKTICPTEVPFSDWGNRDEAVSANGTYTHYIVGGSLRYGCDSIEIMHLTIRDSIVTHLYDSICDNQLPYNHWDTRADNLLNLTETGIYRDTLTSELTGCDSVLVLHLQVNKTYNTTDTITICASEGSPYIWRPTDKNGPREIAIPFEIDDRVNVKDKQTLVLNDSSVLLQSIHGCDSLVNLRLIVHPTYELVEVDTVDCQDTIDRYSTWIDQLGGVHQIDISESGWITIAENKTTIYGCDSIIGIKLYVRPTYRYDSVYTICQDERITWQGKTYAGSHYGYNYQMLSDGKYAEHRDSVYYLYEPGDSILEAGVHHDTIVYSTMLGCDSTYYLTLNVLPTSNTILDVSICDDMGEYVFETRDKDGTYYDTIPISPITEMIDSVRKDTDFYMRQRTLTTQEGCDSTVHLHLTVTPTYEYITRAEICAKEAYTWRGDDYYKAGRYYDKLITEQGCDSTYILELFVRPVLEIPKTLHACDNQTVMHSDTLWYDPDSVRFAVETTLLWKPGMEIPKPDEYREVHYYTLDGKCDSIIYKYHVHIHPTYDSIATATICSNESYQLHDSFIYTPTVAYHEPGSNPAVLDTLITDKLKTVTCKKCEGEGCDSIFSANIRILPAYKHIDSVTICSNEKYEWQDTVLYEPLGDITITYFYQKSYRTEMNCDSIYEMYLTVHRAYDLEVHDTICADEYYHFGDTLLNQTGEYMDTLRTIYDCDSIVHLYLTVLDTTLVITYDTICVTEKYHFFDTIYTETGLYDTITLNEWGCKQYNYLYLEVIDTTAYEIAIGDIICADDEEIIVYYERLSGKTLIEYSVLFDDLGHAQGFEDIYHATLDTTESYFSIPIPRGEVLPHPNPTYFDSQQGINEYVYEDKYAYPIPNLYRFKIIMHNGICGDSLQRKDTTVSFWYPSWIHEQHWNDGIVLYNEIYNGGYKFSKYQWFLNGDSILGATKEYLYVPNQLEMNQRGECNNYYQLAVTRLEDGYTTFTCPICPVLLYDTIVPQKDYFSVVPTIVSKINPTIHILSTRPGSYKITNLMGNQKQGDFAPDANNYAGSITLDEYLLRGITNHLILVTLTLDTGDQRTIKVIVGN